MNSINRLISAPKFFKAKYIIDFINKSEAIFSLKNKQESKFVLDLNKIQQCTMIGVLLIYKFIEFSVKNNCFNAPAFAMNDIVREAMEKYGFTPLIFSYIKDKKKAEKEFKKLKVSITDEFIIAPQALLRNDKYSAETLNSKYLPKIQKYYSFDDKIVSMIFLCFSEVLLNFWEHAVDDTQSIIVANGNKSNLEIACADNGEGIISTLENSEIYTNRKNPESVISKAVKKGITSKSHTNHMGYGLWLIDEIAKRTGGRLHIYSEGGYYIREFGKVKNGKSGYWQGTIIYISLPLDKPITLADIEKPELDNKFNLKINWA